MDNKRLLLAMALAVVVMFGWQYLFPTPKPAPVQTTANGTQTSAQAPADQQTQAQPAAVGTDEFSPSEGRSITVNTPLYTAVFNSQGGILERFELHKYKQTIQADSPDMELVGDAAMARAPMGVTVSGDATWSEYSWDAGSAGDVRVEGQEQVLRFVGELNGLRLERELTFFPDSYLIKEKTTVMNGSGNPQKVTLGYSLAAGILSGGAYNKTRVATYDAVNGLEEEASAKNLVDVSNDISNPQWAAITDNYFLIAMVPEGDSAPAADFKNKVFKVSLGQGLGDLNPDRDATTSCTYYLGPKDRNILETMPGNLIASVDYGWFDFIAKPLLIALNFFHSFLGNWGLAIILLTICIKILFWPLSKKSYQSMNRMKKIQPHITKLREKYKGDRAKMNEEMMSLYKTYKVNPAGGCLPMLVQIPVFFGLYRALLFSIDLRHSPFISKLPFTDLPWLADLSAKDPFYITPIVMGATMFLQQRMTPTTGDKTQARIMMLMPVVFTFLFVNFPAGLVVYWLVNNVLSIFQQWMLIKKSN